MALISFAALAAQDPERLDLRESLRRSGLSVWGLLVGMGLDVVSGLCKRITLERIVRVLGFGRGLIKLALKLSIDFHDFLGVGV